MFFRDNQFCTFFSEFSENILLNNKIVTGVQKLNSKYYENCQKKIAYYNS